FSATTLRTPGLTLFPYTTLFRSRPSGGDRLRRARGHRGRVLVVRREAGAARSRRALPPPPRAPGELAGRADRSVARAAMGPRAADRKSTRLNSSHVSISYAVFCL